VAQDAIDIALPLAAALAAGGLIGFERSFHGRPAGFRTHALVCLGAAMLMLVPTYQPSWLGIAADNNFSTNPSRMAQGIMTGIGFIGAGVVFKQGFFTVRGLTTAASSAAGRLFLSGNSCHARRPVDACRVALVRMAGCAPIVRAADALLC
jgi:putative Mg2+ transporter-C (MgtC) family protein